MKNNVLILFILMVSVPLYSQKSLTLKECYEKALHSNSLAGEKDAYSNIWKLKDRNLSKSWLPTLDANASFVYNSDVVDMRGAFSSVTIPGLASAIKPLPHEQYKVTLDINQVIYDGGAIKGAKAMEKADLIINEQQTEVDLYKIKGQVNNCYFALLLLERQKELLNDYLELINKRLFSMQSALNNGIIVQSDIDVLTSEKIRIGQQLGENQIKKVSLTSILSDLTGSVIDPQTVLIMPQSGNNLPIEISRPELKVFDLRKDQLNAGLDVIQSKRMPKAFGFATLGYGNPPGSNFFKNEFASYYVLGAGLKWNIFDWNKANNEKQQIKIQQGIIENRKTDLTDNLKRMLQSKNAEIASLQSLIDKDSELINIRKRIAAVAESQYENGTITATEYLSELNSEKEAMINYEIHKINLAMAEVEFLNISGKEIE
jgi:outer membrane protein TolC